MQLMNHSMASAPTVEKAASLLDTALSCRTGNRPGVSSHMFFTLHVHQQHTQGPAKDVSEYCLSPLASYAVESQWFLWHVSKEDALKVLTDPTDEGIFSYSFDTRFGKFEASFSVLDKLLLSEYFDCPKEIFSVEIFSVGPSTFEETYCNKQFYDEPCNS